MHVKQRKLFFKVYLPNPNNNSIYIRPVILLVFEIRNVTERQMGA